MADYGAPSDDTARFLRELRQLRDAAGLGQAELAARAHFPYDSIRAAEIGPALPDLPVLCAYVRGCGGTTEEWEERWRSLTSSPSLPVAATRNAGRSDAATAGARIGSVSPVGDNPDPSIIIAALSRVAEEMASPSAAAVAPVSDIQTADDFSLADAPFPSAERAFPPAAERAFPSAAEPFAPATEAFPSAPEPITSAKPAGWDPIRVSTAWPAIRDTPPFAAEPARGSEPAGSTGMGVPWGQGTQDAASAGRSRAGSAAPGGRRPASGATRVPSAASAAGGSGRPASLTKVVVIAAVLLCVLAVLLAVFA